MALKVHAYFVPRDSPSVQAYYWHHTIDKTATSDCFFGHFSIFLLLFMLQSVEKSYPVSD